MKLFLTCIRSNGLKSLYSPIFNNVLPWCPHIKWEAFESYAIGDFKECGEKSSIKYKKITEKQAKHIANVQS